MHVLRRVVAVFAVLLIAATWRLWTPQDVFPQVPFLESDGFRIGGEMVTTSLGSFYEGGSWLPLDHWVVVALQFGAFGLKVILLCWFQLLVRWTLPRFRADQLMNLGWKLLLPLALANIMVTALIKLLVQAFTTPGVPGGS